MFLTKKSARAFALFCLSCVFAFGLKAETAQQENCPIIPHPETYLPTGEEFALPADGNGFIVIDQNADQVVKYAAERFQTMLARLANRHYRIVSEVPAGAELAVLLGEPQNDSRVADFCARKQLDVSEKSWGFDGFLIGFDKKDNTRTVCVAAGIPRGVIYGQEALTWLIARRDGKPFLREAAVRDHAKIPWRSFAWNQNKQYLTPGTLDAYADARLNCIELRDGIEKHMYGQFGYTVDSEINGEQEKTVLAEARRRGMFVWGVVCCGVKNEENEKVIAHFEKLISLGVDGLYISFDDPGIAGDAPVLVKRILELAKKHGYDDDRIAFLPPDPDYGRPYSEFNLNMLKQVPELKNVRWFLTASPSLEFQEILSDMGIQRKRGWFFNWPMGGKAAYRSVYCFGKRGYRPVPDFYDSYDRMNEKMLRIADQSIDSVMVWVRGYPYLAQLLGGFAWNPSIFEQDTIRRRIYTQVYGADLADTVMKFDNYMTDLKGMLNVIGPWDWAQYSWHLSRAQNLKHAKMLLEKLKTLQKKIAAEAPKQTWLDPNTLNEQYLVPMQNTVAALDTLLTTDFPEVVYPNFDRDYRWEKKHGREVAYIKYWRTKINPMLAVIEKRFSGMPHTKQYIEDWRKKLTLPGE